MEPRCESDDHQNAIYPMNGDVWGWCVYRNLNNCSIALGWRFAGKCFIYFEMPFGSVPTSGFVYIYIRITLCISTWKPELHKHQTHKQQSHRQPQINIKTKVRSSHRFLIGSRVLLRVRAPWISVNSNLTHKHTKAKAYTKVAPPYRATTTPFAVCYFACVFVDVLVQPQPIDAARPYHPLWCGCVDDAHTIVLFMFSFMFLSFGTTSDWLLPAMPGWCGVCCCWRAD